MSRDTDFFDRLLERLDRLDPASVQGYILRLVRERGLLDTVFRNLREGILIIDRQQHIHYVNEAAKGLLGLPDDIEQRENQLIGRYLRELDWDQLCAGSRGDPATHVSARYEIEVYYPRQRVLEFYLLPLRDEAAPGGRSEMSAIILHDVTEQRRQSEASLEAERLNAITMLAGAVAHEIGNPLNSLTIHLQLLERHFREQDDTESTRDARELLQVAGAEVQRLDTIINQFLRAIRPAALKAQLLSLPDVVSESLRFLRHEIEDREVQVECQWSEDLPRIMGDPDQLKQALYNIIANAINAMPGGGQVRIGLTQHDNWLLLKIADTGKGIAADDLGRIFEPYFTTRETGTGLGLVIVERILRDHGARLGVESEVGQGTVFRIEFPIRDQTLRLLPEGEE